MKATNQAKPSAKSLAIKFAEKAKEYGFSFEASSSVVKIRKRIPIGDNEAFANAEMEASILLYDICPLKGGSVWGTDGGSIGGMVAMQSGNFSMNKSGRGVSFTKALNSLKR